MPVTRQYSVILNHVIHGENLDFATAKWVMDQVMRGNLSPVQVAGFLVALRTKGETPEEIDALSQSVIEHAHPIQVDGDFVDLVGTGGDQANTVNISTMGAIVTAACGVRVVKHGNRAASSKSGTADVLEAMGLPLTLSPQQVQDIAMTSPMSFCFAQIFHPAFRFAAQARKELAVPTAFNILGPLSNPAQATAVAIGVADLNVVRVMAEVFARRNVRGLVFRNGDGLDELAPTADHSLIYEVRDGQLTEHTLDLVSEVGLTRCSIADLRGGDPTENAIIMREVLSGKHPLIRQTVLLNASAALVAHDHNHHEPLVVRLRAAYERAASVIDNGQALQTLQSWVAQAQEVANQPTQ